MVDVPVAISPKHGSSERMDESGQGLSTPRGPESVAAAGTTKTPGFIERVQARVRPDELYREEIVRSIFGEVGTPVEGAAGVLLPMCGCLTVLLVFLLLLSRKLAVNYVPIVRTLFTVSSARGQTVECIGRTSTAQPATSSAQEVIRTRIQSRALLLYDIHSSTAAAVPVLLLMT